MNISTIFFSLSVLINLTDYWAFSRSGYLVPSYFQLVFLNGENFIRILRVRFFFWLILFSLLCLRGELSITATFIRLRSTQIWFDTFEIKHFLVIFICLFFLLLLLFLPFKWIAIDTSLYVCAVNLLSTFNESVFIVYWHIVNALTDV